MGGNNMCDNGEEEKEMYFLNFIREALKDLNNGKYTYAFNEEQVDEIRKIYPDISVHLSDGIYYLLLDKEKVR